MVLRRQGERRGPTQHCHVLLILIAYALGILSGQKLSSFNWTESLGSSFCPPCDATTASQNTDSPSPDEIDPAVSLPAAASGEKYRPRVTCDPTACNGTFQYDPPNRHPNATDIMLAENKTYHSRKHFVFFPESTTPEGCIAEWEANQRAYIKNGMSGHREDLTIFGTFFNQSRYWNSERFYVEIGGHNGVKETNTRLFDVCLGWSGLMVEPIPQSYRRMVNFRPNAHHLNMAPSCTAPDVARFHDHPFTNAVANKEGATMEIHCGPLSRPLAQMGVRRVDFWSLDVEGSELAVLKTVDWDVVRIDVIVAESQNGLPGKARMAEEVREYLRGRGYIVMTTVRVAASDIFLHKNACADYMHLPECAAN